MFEDENGNRPGDWMHKAQRTRESANDLHEDPNAKPWYQQTFWIIVLIALFWPAGIILAWRSSWPLAAKIAATAIVTLYVAFAMYTLQIANTAA